MARMEKTVQELVSDIQRGTIKKPEMQREYVWRATRVRDLLDSLYRGYPSGTILLWQTSQDVPTSNFAVKTETANLGNSLLLLDGQQRLTSLSSVIRGEPIIVREKKKLRSVDILFNLEHPDELLTVTEIDDSITTELSDEDDDEEEDYDDDSLLEKFNQFTFIVSNNQLAGLPNWVNVTQVFQSTSDAEFLKRAGITSLEDPLYIKYTERLRRLRDIKKYVYRLDVLEPALSYEEVTEIFIRVNSLGVKLRSADLALAQITAKWNDSLKEFQGYQDKCSEEQGFLFDIGFFIRALVIMASSQCKFKRVGALELNELQNGWIKAKKALDFALNFLKSNARITSPVLLTSPFIVLAIAYWGSVREYKIDKHESSEMRRWVLIANTKSRFSGSAETLLDQDLAMLRDGGNTRDLLDRLEVQFGRLNVTETELVGRRSSSGYFRAMYLAFLEDGAKDWTTDLAISLRHSGSEHKLQFHHIFPKALLRREFPGMRRAQINDISNLAFIGGKTNRQIRDKAPADYLVEMLTKREFDSELQKQCIPTEKSLLEQDSFEEFLKERRRLVAMRINELLES